MVGNFQSKMCLSLNANHQNWSKKSKIFILAIFKEPEVSNIFCIFLVQNGQLGNQASFEFLLKIYSIHKTQLRQINKYEFNISGSCGLYFRENCWKEELVRRSSKKWQARLVLIQLAAAISTTMTSTSCNLAKSLLLFHAQTTHPKSW